MEIWKPVQGYEDLYEVSSYGRFRSKERIVITNGIPRKRPSKIRKPVFINKKGGFYTVALIRDKVRKNVRFAPIVARHFCGEPPFTVQEEVGFKDGDRHNLRADNLYWREPDTYDIKDGVLVTGTDNIYITPYGVLYKMIENKPVVFRGHRHRLGYIGYTYHINGVQYQVKAHRLVAEHFVENPKPSQYNVVDHIDGNPFNNHYSNLRWCTQTMNCRFSRKILPSVPFVKYYISEGYSDRQIADMYEVDIQVIRRIRLGKTYSDIKMEKPLNDDSRRNRKN